MLTSEGERESAINSAQGRAESDVLSAQARQKAAILDAEAQQKAIVMKAQALRQEQILQAQAAAEAMQIIAKTLTEDPRTREALQFILAQQYLEMGLKIWQQRQQQGHVYGPQKHPCHAGRGEGHRRGRAVAGVNRLTFASSPGFFSSGLSFQLGSEPVARADWPLFPGPVSAGASGWRILRSGIPRPFMPMCESCPYVYSQITQYPEPDTYPPLTPGTSQQMP